MVIIALMAAFGLRQAQEGESKVIRLAVLAAVPFLIVRSDGQYTRQWKEPS